MIILGINTATAKTEVALVEVSSAVSASAKILFEKSWKSNRDEAEKVLPAVQTALKKLAGKKKLDYIFVVHGPGPFTGLRVGVTIANTLAFVLKVPIISCDTFEYYRARLPEARRADTAVVLRAGGDFVAVKRPQDFKSKKTEPKIMVISELENFSKNVKYLTGDLSLSEAILKNLGRCSAGGELEWLNEKSLLKFSSAIAAQAAFKKKGAKARGYNIVEPTYLRPPKITTSKKENFTK